MVLAKIKDLTPNSFFGTLIVLVTIHCVFLSLVHSCRLVAYSSYNTCGWSKCITVC